MTKIPTDLKMLGAIYDRYYADFVAYSDENKTRSSKIYVPIDIEELARSMSLDSDIVFGRLYYHLNEKFGYKNDELSDSIKQVGLVEPKNPIYNLRVRS